MDRLWLDLSLLLLDHLKFIIVLLLDLGADLLLHSLSVEFFLAVFNIGLLVGSFLELTPTSSGHASLRILLLKVDWLDVVVRYQVA